MLVQPIIRGKVAKRYKKNILGYGRTEKYMTKSKEIGIDVG